MSIQNRVPTSSRTPAQRPQVAGTTSLGRLGVDEDGALFQDENYEQDQEDPITSSEDEELRNVNIKKIKSNKNYN